MTPTPEIIAATLRLPLPARRALAAQPGPGWWVTEKQRLCIVMKDAHLDVYEPNMVKAGWAWLPANDTAWMEAAMVGLTGGYWNCCGGKEWWIGHYPKGPDDTPMVLCREQSAPLCALKRWGAL